MKERDKYGIWTQVKHESLVPDWVLVLLTPIIYCLFFGILLIIYCLFFGILLLVVPVGMVMRVVLN